MPEALIFFIFPYVISNTKFHQENTLPGCHQSSVTFLAGQAGGPGEGDDCSNGEEEGGLGA